MKLIQSKDLTPHGFPIEESARTSTPKMACQQLLLVPYLNPHMVWSPKQLLSKKTPSLQPPKITGTCYHWARCPVYNTQKKKHEIVTKMYIPIVTYSKICNWGFFHHGQPIYNRESLPQEMIPAPNEQSGVDRVHTPILSNRSIACVKPFLPILRERSFIPSHTIQNFVIPSFFYHCTRVLHHSFLCFIFFLPTPYKYYPSHLFVLAAYFDLK